MVRCSGPRIKMLGPLSEEQIAELQKRLREVGRDAAALCGTFGVETLDQLSAANFKRAVERIDSVRRRHAGGYSREELDRARDKEERAFPALRRMRQHREAGMDFDEAWDLGLAEELAERRSWSLWLLKRAAERFLEYHKPKLEERRYRKWKRETFNPFMERDRIDVLAKQLKAKGVRAHRGKAEELYAKEQGVTVHALRKRRQRRRKY
jgi:hypothetical protein